MTPASTPLVTLTTDFGLRDPYVATLKGTIYAINAGLQVVDLSQQGLNTFTFGAPVAAELFASDLTNQAAAQFQAAALAMNGQD